jgi:hypothetical protein
MEHMLLDKEEEAAEHWLVVLLPLDSVANKSMNPDGLFVLALKESVLLVVLVLKFLKFFSVTCAPVLWSNGPIALHQYTQTAARTG